MCHLPRGAWVECHGLPCLVVRAGSKRVRIDALGVRTRVLVQRRSIVRLLEPAEAERMAREALRAELAKTCTPEDVEAIVDGNLAHSRQ